MSFRERRYVIDFWIWFRWEPVGALKDYNPLESFELINGRVDAKSSIVEKEIDKVKLASARVTANVSQAWDVNAFPFDRHRLQIHIEDSKYAANDLVFELDLANSRLGDEIELSGWTVTEFEPRVTNKVYDTNFGDVSLPTRDVSVYSRFTYSMDLLRETHDAAIKLLGGMFFATLVAFSAFLVSPSDTNTRFGIGVGALFAVATSAVIAAQAVPDSSALTAADKLHMISMGFIFASLLQSSLCMKLVENGHEFRSRRLDLGCLVAFPLLFALICGGVVLRVMK